MTCIRRPNECYWWNATIPCTARSSRRGPLGQADYHITKPWTFEQDLYRVVSQFLAEWATDQETGFDLFLVIGRPQDRTTHELQDLLTRFNVPFRFQTAESEQGRRLIERDGATAIRLAHEYVAAAEHADRLSPALNG
jgi:hypothetical protein